MTSLHWRSSAARMASSISMVKLPPMHRTANLSLVVSLVKSHHVRFPSQQLFQLRVGALPGRYRIIPLAIKMELIWHIPVHVRLKRLRPIGHGLACILTLIVQCRMRRHGVYQPQSNRKFLPAPVSNRLRENSTFGGKESRLSE